MLQKTQVACWYWCRKKPSPCVMITADQLCSAIVILADIFTRFLGKNWSQVKFLFPKIYKATRLFYCMLISQISVYLWILLSCGVNMRGWSVQCTLISIILPTPFYDCLKLSALYLKNSHFNSKYNNFHLKKSHFNLN